MKYIILLSLLVSCAQNTVVVDKTPSTKSALAWGDKPLWDKAVREEIALHDWSNVKSPCKKTEIKECVAQLISIIAKRESNFKPDTTYNETGHLAGVVSRGLLQISKDSANQSAYKCGINDAKELHDPVKNLKCGIKILAFQSKKTGVLIDGLKGGCGAYWSVCRSKNGTSDSYKVISSYMSKL